MGASSAKGQPHPSTAKRLLLFVIYVLLPIALLRFYFYRPSHSIHPSSDKAPEERIPIIALESPSSEDYRKEQQHSNESIKCDYSVGKWVSDEMGPPYSGGSCRTIKDGQNCMVNGRPDMGYLYWRWKPAGCRLPRFDPSAFLRLFQNKRLAFVGDSMARNQLESLLCLLSLAAPPTLMYQDGEERKFRRWHLPSHNITISIYWSPFLVKGDEKYASTGLDHNRLYVDLVDERWATEIGFMDLILLSVGHWFLHPAVYFEGGSAIGCHYCQNRDNLTEIGFYEVFSKSLGTALKAIAGNEAGRRRVIVTTFSPSHFEGEWDKAGACAKQQPFREDERGLEGMDAEMRRLAIEQAEVAKRHGLEVEALDVSRLSLLRPDGHPGPYMRPFPFANGLAPSQRVQNDCVHWCLPGPVDTWNEILLEMMKNWEVQ